jgi:hypothetical protein
VREPVLVGHLNQPVPEVSARNRPNVRASHPFGTYYEAGEITGTMRSTTAQGMSAASPYGIAHGIVLDTNVVLQAFPSTDAFAPAVAAVSELLSGSVSPHESSLSSAFQTPLDQSVLHWIRLAAFPSSDVLTQGLEQQNELAPYLAIVRRALQHNDLRAAASALEAIPIHAMDDAEVRRLKTLLAPPRITMAPERDVDRAREFQWLRHRRHDYRGQWVAIEGDTLLAHASSLKALREVLKGMNLVRPPLVQRID